MGMQEYYQRKKSFLIYHCILFVFIFIQKTIKKNSSKPFWSTNNFLFNEYHPFIGKKE